MLFQNCYEGHPNNRSGFHRDIYSAAPVLWQELQCCCTQPARAPAKNHIVGVAEDRCRAKRKMSWQVQELFCLREPVASSDPRSEPKTDKNHFSLKRDFKLKRWQLLSLWRDSQLDISWYQLIPDYTKLLCAGAQQVGGGGIGTDTLIEFACACTTDVEPRKTSSESTTFGFSTWKFIWLTVVVGPYLEWWDVLYNLLICGIT